MTSSGPPEGGNNPFLSVMAFMETLTNSCEDGRILLKRGLTVGKGVLKFLLLNPAAHFRDIVLQSRFVNPLVLCHMHYLF